MPESHGMSTSSAPSPHILPSAAGGTVLAFDFGLRHIGVAVGETLLGVAHPLGSIEAERNDARFAAIGRYIDEWQPARLVLGLPLNMDGSEHELTLRVRRFARQLEGRYNRPVDFVDERLTSLEAEGRLREMERGGRANKALSHPLAAQIILQNYFDEQLSA